MQLLLLFLALLFSSCIYAQEPARPGDARPPLLQALDGRWVMNGDVRGKPVRYTMLASPTLQATFTEMHMLDVQVPPRYEARVLIGFDAASQSVIVHWLDSFGAKYSIPHATGQITGATLGFTFPYPGGSFRDTLTYDKEHDCWTLQIEAAQPDGSWKHFAQYFIRRE